MAEHLEANDGLLEQEETVAEPETTTEPESKPEYVTKDDIKGILSEFFAQNQPKPKPEDEDDGDDYAKTIEERAYRRIQKDYEPILSALAAPLAIQNAAAQLSNDPEERAYIQATLAGKPAQEVAYIANDPVYSKMLKDAARKSKQASKPVRGEDGPDDDADSGPDAYSVLKSFGLTNGVSREEFNKIRRNR